MRPAAVPASDLGHDEPGRRARAAGHRDRASCERQDGRFHMEGGSWTNDISWVRGYDSLLIPMERASAAFHQRVLARNIPTTEPALPQRAVSPAHRRRRAATATGARDNGPTTAQSSRGAPPKSSPTTSDQRVATRTPSTPGPVLTHKPPSNLDHPLSHSESETTKTEALNRIPRSPRNHQDEEPGARALSSTLLSRPQSPGPTAADRLSAEGWSDHALHRRRARRESRR